MLFDLNLYKSLYLYILISGIYISNNYQSWGTGYTCHQQLQQSGLDYQVLISGKDIGLNDLAFKKWGRQTEEFLDWNPRNVKLNLSVQLFFLGQLSN